MSDTPQPGFISVGSLGEAFRPGGHVLPAVDDLAGRKLAWVIDGVSGELRMNGDGTAGWDQSGDVPVRVSSIRAGVYLIDGLATSAAATNQPPTSVTWLVDFDQALITRVIGRLPDPPTLLESAYDRVRRGLDPTGVVVAFGHGRLLTQQTGEPIPAGDDSGPLHAPTDALVGLRTRYTYSPQEQYEHVYLNPHRFTWHCLAGAERGLADTERCTTIGIADSLYLFAWQEKIIPTLGLILIDLQAMRTDGKIFGHHEFDTGRTVNFPVGALAEVVNRTSYVDSATAQS